MASAIRPLRSVNDWNSVRTFARVMLCAYRAVPARDRTSEPLSEKSGYSITCSVTVGY